MDTHHLISAESVNISELEDLLIEKGYNINAIDNLVGLPATLLKWSSNIGHEFVSMPLARKSPTKSRKSNAYYLRWLILRLIMLLFIKK